MSPKMLLSHAITSLTSITLTGFVCVYALLGLLDILLLIKYARKGPEEA